MEALTLTGEDTHVQIASFLTTEAGFYPENVTHFLIDASSNVKTNIWSGRWYPLIIADPYLQGCMKLSV